MGRNNPARQRAVFLDRDGVINRNIWNPATSQHESPLTEKAFELLPDVLSSLSELQGAGLLLFVVSNQPSYAKGKVTLETLSAIDRRLIAETTQSGIEFTACYYCLHHPQGIVPGYAGACVCRKPSPYFLHQAREKFSVDLSTSWMIGDRESDVECGKSAGVRTILITDRPSTDITTAADSSARNLPDATRLILD